jgi:hypothetical protein
MSSETTTKTRGRSKSTGCGCGGNKAGGSSNCTCNDQTPPCPNVGILRPNFFAGQLLTEDDLQQITTYQNAKRRLTNRYVFGTGVVCGLEVVASSDPKTPGVITVNPGYALDCCGNDIVLSCPYPIDVNTMIRDQGLDCGDPCEEAKAEEWGKREYLLCVRYSEVPSEPISPYSPGTTPTCVNTRYAESCTFELQCPPKKCEPSSDLREKLADLLEETDDALSVDVKRWQTLCDMGAALTTDPQPLTLQDDDFKALAGAPDTIASFADSLPTKVPLSNWTDEAMGTAIKALAAPARTFARFQYADPTKITTMPAGTFPGTTEMNTRLSEVSTALVAAQKQLAAALLPSFSEGVVLRSRLLQDEIKRWTDSTAGAIDKLRNRHDVRPFVFNGEPYSFGRYKEAIRGLAQRFDGIKIPADADEDFKKEDLDQVCELARRFQGDENHAFHEALCSLVNPPCQSCDNLCVILASICVRQCKVVAVCNLVRTIIISPAALGYWLPLQEILQALCCRESSRGGELGTLENLIKPFQTAGDRFFQRETPTTAKVSNTTKVPTQGAEPSGTH